MAYEDDAFLGTPTILVVDDSPTITTLFARLLADVARVVVANDGTQGLLLARAEMPDLILLDVSMPGQDGFDVISELKTDPNVRHIPVMFITGEVLPEIESHCLEAGAVDYIAKPVTPRVLLARARTHLLLKQQADMLAELSFRDQLTGALNRISFDERLDSECRRSRAGGRSLALVLVGVDEFDAYNQIYGFVAGDDVLVAVAEAMRPLAERPGAVLARTGPAEFALLLPETTGAEAVQMADGVRDAVGRLGVRHGGSPADVVTVSAAVAAADPCVEAGALIRQAEQRLAGISAAGGNAVAAD
jgi:diguanylate cyclase (GGDEF)-like protein